MKAVGIKNLKNHLSEYIRLVSAGETVLVTERERVVAELVPPQMNRATHIHDALLADAVRNGWITPQLLVGVPLPRRKPIMPLKQMLTELDQDRADR